MDSLRSLCLQISGASIDPDAVTEKLGVTPTMSRMLPSQTSEPFGVWVLDTRGHVLSDRLVDHVRWLSSRLTGAESELRALRDHSEVELLAAGAPDSWDWAGMEADDLSTRLGLDLAFVVFRPGPREIRITGDV